MIGKDGSVKKKCTHRLALQKIKVSHIATRCYLNKGCLFTVVLVALCNMSFWSYTSMKRKQEENLWHQSYASMKDEHEKNSFFGDTTLLDIAHLTKNPAKNEVLVFLTTMAAFETFMDRGFFHQYKAAKQLGYNVIMWGKGFPNYNKTLTLENNFELYFEKKQISVFAVYEMGCECKLAQLAKKYITINKWHECWGDACSKIAERLNVSIMLHAYPNDIIFQSYISRSYGGGHNRRLIEHAPNTAMSQIFSQDPDEKRDIDILLVGAVYKGIYPIRHKLRKILEEIGHWKDPTTKKTLNVVVRSHPGYSEMTETEYDEAIANKETVPNHEKCDAQVDDYANQMKRAKITVVGSSYLKYQVKKYAEAAMSGTLLIGNTPSGLESQWGQVVVNVEGMSNQNIKQTLRYWLYNKEERLKRARVGYDFVHKYLTSKHQVRRMVGAVHRYRKGERGLSFPFPHKTLCAGQNPSSPETNGFCECIRNSKSVCRFYNDIRRSRGRTAQMYFDGPNYDALKPGECALWSKENGLKVDCASEKLSGSKCVVFGLPAKEKDTCSGTTKSNLKSVGERRSLVTLAFTTAVVSGTVLMLNSL